MRLHFRILMLLSVLVALVGAGFALNTYINRQIVLRVVVTSADGEDAAMVTAINRWFSANGKRYRLRTVIVADPEEGFRAIEERKADFISLRADHVPPPSLASVLVLYKEVAFVLGLPQSGITSFAQMKAKTIGVTGKTTVTDPLLQTLLKLQGASDAKIVSLPAAQLQSEMQKKSIQAIAHVGPLNGAVGNELRAIRPLRNMRGELTLLGLEDAETAATLNRQYEDFDIPAGAIRSAPPVPSETISTLSVSRHMVGRRSVASFFVGRFLADMMDARRGILADLPLAAQIGAPDTETNAVMPVHPGAVAYFDNEQTTLYEFLTEWSYIILLVVGALGTGLVGLANRLWPDDASASSLAYSFAALRNEASAATSKEDLSALQERLGTLFTLMGEQFTQGEIERADIHMVLMAADMAERKLAEKRSTLAQQASDPLPARKPASS